MKNCIKVLIIDDEYNSCNLIGKLLKTFPDVEVLGFAGDADEGIKLVLEMQPDLLFLDISMPGKDGLDMANELRSMGKLPDIIFVTAFDQYAIQAFKVCAFDYLLKPIDINDLEASLVRYRGRKNSVDLESRLNLLLKQVSKVQRNEKISLPTRTGVAFFVPEDIVYLEAEGNYTCLYTINDDKHYISYNIGKVEDIIPDDIFVRIGRSFVINYNYLTGFDRKAKTIALMCGENQIEIPVALKAIKKLETIIK